MTQISVYRAAGAAGQRVPVWPAINGTPLGPPDSLLLCKFHFIVLLHRTEKLSFRGGAKPRRGNLQHGSMTKCEPINIESIGFSMLIGCCNLILLSRRLHHRHSLRSHVAWLVSAMLLAMTVVVGSCQRITNSKININLQSPYKKPAHHCAGFLFIHLPP